MNSGLNTMKPRWRKVLADMWDSKSRTLLVVASIAVGVFAVGAIASSFVIMSEDIDISYISIQPANIEIITDGFDEGFLKSVERIRGVEAAEGRALVDVRARVAGDAWQTVGLVGIDDFSATRLNRLRALEGQAIPGAGEVVFSYDLMNDTGFAVGQTVEIQLPDDTTSDLKIVGIVSDQSKAGDFASPPRGFVNLDEFGTLGLPETYSRLYVSVSGDKGDETAISSLATAAEDKLEKSGRRVYATTTTQTDQHPMTSTILALLGVLGALGLLVMLLSGALIFNTLNALLNQQVRQIGVMKLVGAQSRQISGMYVALILIYGLIALAVAVPLGMLAGYGLSLFIAGFMSAELQGFRIVPIAVILQVIVALLVPLAAGYFPVHRGSKIKIRRAISNDAAGGGGPTTSLTNRAGSLAARVSRPLTLSIRNTFRRKGRLILTLFTLTMAGAIFIAVFNVRSSLERFMDQIAMHFMADVSVDFDEPYRSSEVEAAALEVPGVEHVEGWQNARAEVVAADDTTEAELIIFGPPVDSELVHPDMIAGRWLQPGDRHGIVFADSIWDDLPGLQPGDTVRVSVQGGRAEDWNVLGIFRFSDMIGVQLAYTDYDTMADVLNRPDKSTSYRMVANAQTLRQQQAVSVAVDEHFRELDFKVGDVEAGLVSRQQNSQAINILVTFLLLMALLTAFVGSIGLAGTMGMNVLERTREIGVMRAIGAVDLDIIKAVVTEGILIGLISWVLAILLSFPISLLLLTIVGRAMINAVMPMALTPWGIIIWLGVVMALAVLASMIPARSAARLTIREVLAYE